MDDAEEDEKKRIVLAAEDREKRVQILYEKALAQAPPPTGGEVKYLTNDDFVRLAETSTQLEAHPLIQALHDALCLRYLKATDDSLRYSTRASHVAEALRTLRQKQGDDFRDLLLIYETVENAGNGGAWTKRIKGSTGLVQTVINKGIKLLEQTHLIKLIKNIKNPTQKSYILYDLTPGSDVEGGPFHQEGELDQEMVAVLTHFIVQKVSEITWGKGTSLQRHRSVSPIELNASSGDSAPAKAGSKRKQSSIQDIEDMRPRPHKRRDADESVIHVQVPFGPEHRTYPTTEDILDIIRKGRITNRELEVQHVQELIDVLIWDDRLEAMANGGYRSRYGVHTATEAMRNPMAIRDVGDEGDGPGLVQAPCGKCPVFDLCEDGGPVNARNCEYFDHWLKS